ncbi:MAG: hypothetical protein LHW46_01750 [Candidatus Cloacimonetes bacterium]|nr:hypothetical protein [Candidatus Cloacimonadota bacterium]MCK9333013.1 hypothetical protein [Candidatus Cloacimonadota bacterium]
MKKVLMLTSVLLVLAINTTCSAQIVSSNHSFRDLWNIPESKYLPTDTPISYDLIAEFNKAYFDSLENKMSQNKPGFFIPLGKSFISDRDTLSIGFPYSYETNEYISNTDIKRRLSGLIRTDINGGNIALSPIGYSMLRDPANFKGMTSFRVSSDNGVFQDYPELRLQGDSVFEGVFKVADREPIIEAYQELYNALATNANLHREVNFNVYDFYITKDKSYCYDTSNRKLYSYHVSSNMLSVYTLPVSNEVINRIGSDIEDLHFVASVNDFLVFSDATQYWCVMLVDTKSDKVYLFYTKYITDMVGVKDVEPIGNGGSGFSIYPTDYSVYVKAKTLDGSFYVIRVNLNR